MLGLTMDISTDWICEYDPPTGMKFQATYSGGQTYEKECNGDSTLAYAETHHDEVKGASKEVRLAIEELQKEENKVNS